MYLKIKIDPLDQLVSKIVRLRAKNHCQRCFKWTDFGNLQAAHCFGRRKKSVRYDLQNLLAVCFACHRIIDGEEPEAKRELFIKYLGEEDYKKLGMRANWAVQYKPDKAAIKLMLVQELKKYEN